MDDFRCGVVKSAYGRVLEFGPGGGANFKCWGKDRQSNITDFVGVDPNQKFARKLQETAEKEGVPFNTTLVGLRGEDVDIEPASFDFVVATHVLCSVSDRKQVLRQVERALKPGGTFLFMEHVLARTWESEVGFVDTDAEMVLWWQKLVAPFFNVVGRGCTFSEQWTDLLFLQDLGMDLKLSHIAAPHSLSILRPHVVGYAHKPLQREPEPEHESTHESEQNS